MVKETKTTKPILTATKYNWGMHCPGEWETVIWNVYETGEYHQEIQYCTRTSDETPNIQKHSGKLNRLTLFRLKQLLRQPWPQLNRNCKDGIGWEFSDHCGKNTSCGYIYNEKTLLRISALLPRVPQCYDG